MAASVHFAGVEHFKDGAPIADPEKGAVASSSGYPASGVVHRTLGSVHRVHVRPRESEPDVPPTAASAAAVSEVVDSRGSALRADREVRPAAPDLPVVSYLRPERMLSPPLELMPTCAQLVCSFITRGWYTPPTADEKYVHLLRSSTGMCREEADQVLNWTKTTPRAYVRIKKAKRRGWKTIDMIPNFGIVIKMDRISAGASKLVNRVVVFPVRNFEGETVLHTPISAAEYRIDKSRRVESYGGEAVSLIDEIHRMREAGIHRNLFTAPIAFWNRGADPTKESMLVYGASGTILDFIEGNSERVSDITAINTALRGMLEVGEGLRHLHSRGIIHRDVKPENILMVDGVAKLSDLTDARTISEVQDMYDHAIVQAERNFIRFCEANPETVDLVELTPEDRLYGIKTNRMFQSVLRNFIEDMSPDIRILYPSYDYVNRFITLRSSFPVRSDINFLMMFVDKELQDTLRGTFHFLSGREIDHKIQDMKSDVSAYAKSVLEVVVELRRSRHFGRGNLFLAYEALERRLTGIVSRKPFMGLPTILEVQNCIAEALS